MLLLVLHGPIATNILNIYSCALCALTVDLKISRRTMAYLVGVFAFAFTVVLIFQESFAHALDGWLASLVVWVAPWAAIMAVHFYFIRRQRIDIEALYDPPGHSRLGDVRWDAMVVVPPRHRRHLVLRVRHPLGAPGPRREGCWATSTCPGWPVSSSPVGCTRCSAPDAGRSRRERVGDAGGDGREGVIASADPPE